jgi:hypothetical protein
MMDLSLKIEPQLAPVAKCPFSAGHGENIRVIILPHLTAVLSAEAEHTHRSKASTFFRPPIVEGWGRICFRAQAALSGSPQ